VLRLLMMMRMRPSQTSRRAAGGLIAFGLILVAVGAFALTVAAAHAPTLSNALTQRWVLKPEAYAIGRVAGWVMLVGGALIALSGVLRREQRAASSEPVSIPHSLPVVDAQPGATPERTLSDARTEPLEEPEGALALWAGQPANYAPPAPQVGSLDERLHEPNAAGFARRPPIRLLVAVTIIGAATLIAVAAVVVSETANPRQGSTPPAEASTTANKGSSPTAPAAATSAPALSTTPTADTSRLAAAEAIVAGQGFDPVEVVGFDGITDLQMILGHSHGSADGGREWAFFFDPDGTYLGTDASEATVGLERNWSDGDTIALRYTLFREDDPQCCPSGGAATVRFHWDGRRVNALDQIPSTTGDPARR
jgi:hypothetical protein